MLAKRILMSNRPEILGPMEDSLCRREGFSMLVAEDGRQAFAFIEEHDPALAILDLEMMHEAGDQCCRRVKGDPILCKTPVILVARRDDEEEVRRCQEAGCNEILFKPLDARELVTTAFRLLQITERRAPRIALTLPAHLGRDARHLRSGTIRNLNDAGAFVKTRKLYPVDTRLVLEFALPEGGELWQCRCRVAWVNHPEWMKALRLPVGMGLQFVELEAPVKEALQSFTAAQKPEQESWADDA